MALHQYTRRSLRTRMERAAAARTETRNAILWSIIPSQRICFVKIQGSNTLIQARYPENLTQTPDWLKVGNSVTVLHKAGNRNSVELIGHGLTVPTPVDGQPPAPVVVAGADAVLSGCQVKPLSTPAMQVWVATGSYRLNGMQYLLGVMLMSATNPVAMGAGIPMGGTGAVVTINAAHATLYRQDALFVGADGVVDYVAGTPSATNPLIPATPVSHVLLGTVFLPPGTTAITAANINKSFVTPTPTSLLVTYPMMQLTWDDTEMVITVKILDQYDLGIIGQNWGIKAEILEGTGSLEDDGLTTVTKYTGPAAHTVTFTYRRVPEETPPLEEKCPVMIYFSLNQNPDVAMQILLLLEDTYGALLL